MSADSNSYNPDATDLDRLHAAVVREKPDAEPGREPIPMWIIFVGFLVTIVAASQLGPFTGSFAFETSNPFLAYSHVADPRPGAAGAGAALDPFQIAMKKGSGAYAVCGGCHQGNGAGIPGQFPPLAGSDWAQGGTERLIRVVLYGLSGPIKVAGQPFHNPAGMPAQGMMSDSDLANALTYVRNSWGNKASMVTKEMVQTVREATKGRTAPWTMAELEEFASKDVPGLPEAPAAAGAK